MEVLKERREECEKKPIEGTAKELRMVWIDKLIFLVPVPLQFLVVSSRILVNSFPVPFFFTFTVHFRPSFFTREILCLTRKVHSLHWNQKRAWCGFWKPDWQTLNGKSVKLWKNFGAVGGWNRKETLRELGTSLGTIWEEIWSFLWLGFK